MIEVPETEHAIDRLARDVADAALELDRTDRDGRYQMEESRMSPKRYRLHAALIRYEQAGGSKGDGKPLPDFGEADSTLPSRYVLVKNENDRLRLLARQYQEARDEAERDAIRAEHEAEDEKGKRIDAEAVRDEALEAVRGYVRECRDAAVLGPGRCRVDRYYTKLEQLA